MARPSLDPLLSLPRVREIRRWASTLQARLRDPSATLAEVRALQASLAAYQLGWPPGHFYSPLPDLSLIRADEARIFQMPTETPGVALRTTEQLVLAKALAARANAHPFRAERRSHLRFAFENPNFSYGEGVVLHGMLRHLRPKRVIEIGSGHSSALMLDTNELFLNNSVQFTFIEPYPDLLYSLMKPADGLKVEILEQRLQDVDQAIFAELDADDILFIDSTHVSKVDSDVNHIFFRVLPALKVGTYIHFHDIYYPFEYPSKWVYEGRAWNEAYLMRSFLTYNSAFSIEHFNSYLGMFYPQLMGQLMPDFMKNPGSSLWLKRMS